jgi:hypothetical protein
LGFRAHIASPHVEILMRRFFLSSTLVLTAACGPSPVGSWTGITGYITADLSTYVNEMEVSDDATADITLYALVEKDEELMMGMGTFDADWEQDGEDVSFDLVCNWDACTWQSTMACALDEDALDCDMTPDYYTDDEAVLQWERDEE